MLKGTSATRGNRPDPVTTWHDQKFSLYIGDREIIGLWAFKGDEQDTAGPVLDSQWNHAGGHTIDRQAWVARVDSNRTDRLAGRNWRRCPG